MYKLLIILLLIFPIWTSCTLEKDTELVCPTCPEQVDTKTDPCIPGSIMLVRHDSRGNVRYDWPLGEVPLVEAIPLDRWGQPIDIQECFIPTSTTWREPYGTASCEYLGDLYGLTKYVKCYTVGTITIESTLSYNGQRITGAANFRIVG